MTDTLQLGLLGAILIAFVFVGCLAGDERMARPRLSAIPDLDINLAPAVTCALSPVSVAYHEHHPRLGAPFRCHRAHCAR